VKLANLGGEIKVRERDWRYNDSHHRVGCVGTINEEELGSGIKKRWLKYSKRDLNAPEAEIYE